MQGLPRRPRRQCLEGRVPANGRVDGAVSEKCPSPRSHMRLRRLPKMCGPVGVLLSPSSAAWACPLIVRWLAPAPCGLRVKWGLESPLHVQMGPLLHSLGCEPSAVVRRNELGTQTGTEDGCAGPGRCGRVSRMHRATPGASVNATRTQWTPWQSQKPRGSTCRDLSPAVSGLSGVWQAAVFPCCSCLGTKGAVMCRPRQGRG